MSIFNEVQAVIFDHDGTLVDSEPVHLRCWQATLTPFGQTLTAQEYTEHLSGIASIESARWLVDKFSLETTAETLLREKQERLHRYLKEQACPLIVDAQPLLEQLHQQGIPMAVASGAGRAEVERSLHFHQLQAYFKATATKDDVPNNKPAPDVYLLAAKQLNVAPDQCLAIEDSDSGQRSAISAGMRCLRINTPSKLPMDHRCRIIPDLSSLLERA